MENQHFQCSQDSWLSFIGSDKKREGNYSADWQKKIYEVFIAFSQEVAPKINDAIAIDTLKREVAILKNRCELIERLSPIQVPIQTFAPYPYILKKQITIVVRYQDDQYTASFFDANISASGDTQEEAIFNIKDMIIGIYDILRGADNKDLGVWPLQQKNILNEFISLIEE